MNRVTGLNHITLAVSDIQNSLNFYTRLLGFEGEVKWDTGAYLSAGELWLCLSQDSPTISKDYSHIALSIAAEDYQAMCLALKGHGVIEWKQNTSEGESFYFLDPDGHKLELHLGGLQSRLMSLQSAPYSGLTWLKKQH